MATQTEDNLRNPLIVSTTLHVVTMLVLYFGIPAFMAPPEAPPWHPVPVDIVEVGEITNTRIKDSEEQEAARTAPPQKPAPAPEVKQPEPPKPPEPKVEQKSEPEPDDAALPQPAKKPKPPEPPKEPKKEEVKQQPQVDPLASVLKNVAKMKPAPQAVPNARPDEKKSEGVSNMNASNSNLGPALSDRLTISQEDALRRQISSCWNMPIGAKDAQNLIVEVLIEVNEDRTVRSAQIVDQLKYNTDTHFRAAADAAVRALRHPKCSPLELPPEQYEQWKTIRFNFDPRDML